MCDATMQENAMEDAGFSLGQFELQWHSGPGPQASLRLSTVETRVEVKTRENFRLRGIMGGEEDGGGSLGDVGRTVAQRIHQRILSSLPMME